jgi:hypothetical protein
MIIHNGELFVVLHMHMLIMVNLSLARLSAFSWVMVLVLKPINCGILKHIKHFIVETLCSMNLLMFTSDLSTSATNQNSESINVQVEHIDDDVAAPSAKNSSPLRYSSPTFHPLQESLTEGRTRRQIV